MEGKRMRRFRDRVDAGRFLARELGSYRNRDDIVVLALPRGGVPVAHEIARELNAPLDVFLVRKLGFPGHEEFALGAIASGGVRVLNPQAFQIAQFSEREIDEIAEKELHELERREQSYRGNRPIPEVRKKTVILVDDGLATGSTMRAAVQALRQLGPDRIIVAVPVGSSDACELLSREADEVICAAIPEPFNSVGQWYENFSQTSDEEVHDILEESHFAA
jgi:putative phosphoribosyl transferase